MKEDCRLVTVCHSLKIVDMYSSCTIDLDQDLSSEQYDVHGESCEPYEIKVDITLPVSSLVPSKIQEIYTS